jgi:hypothetical protein
LKKTAVLQIKRGQILFADKIFIYK